MYFSEHKGVVENDEKGHADRNQSKENKRQKKQKNILTANFFAGLILMQRVFIVFFKLVKYKIASRNQTKKN